MRKRTNEETKSAFKNKVSIWPHHNKPKNEMNHLWL